MAYLPVLVYDTGARGLDLLIIKVILYLLDFEIFGLAWQGLDLLILSARANSREIGPDVLIIHGAEVFGVV